MISQTFKTKNSKSSQRFKTNRITFLSGLIISEENPKFRASARTNWLVTELNTSLIVTGIKYNTARYYQLRYNVLQFCQFTIFTCPGCQSSSNLMFLEYDYWKILLFILANGGFSWSEAFLERQKIIDRRNKYYCKNYQQFNTIDYQRLLSLWLVCTKILEVIRLVNS